MRKIILTVCFIFAWVGAFKAHDLFLKLDTVFLKPNTNASIVLFNGTFEKSENSITRDRMVDVSIVGPERQRSHPDTSHWRDVATQTVLDIQTGEAGTYVVGVSTAARMIELSAKDFNDYLKHDGVLDILDQRRLKNELTQDATERYSKHVKAIIQVGHKHSGAFSARLGYPAELIPLQNPYDLKRGENLEVLFLKDGKPIANQPIYASYKGLHRHDDAGGHAEAIQLRTNENGVAKFQLAASGQWYIRLIHMQEVEDDEADYESNWATLTFEVQ